MRRYATYLMLCLCSVRVACAWTAQSPKRPYISGISAMTADQILFIVIIIFIYVASIAKK